MVKTILKAGTAARYLSLHPEARLAESEVQQLYEWAHRERRRLTLRVEPEPKKPVG